MRPDIGVERLRSLDRIANVDAFSLRRPFDRDAFNAGRRGFGPSKPFVRVRIDVADTRDVPVDADVIGEASGTTRSAIV